MRTRPTPGVRYEREGVEWGRAKRSCESRQSSRVPRPRPKCDGEGGGKLGALDTPWRCEIATGSRQGFECCFGRGDELETARCAGGGLGQVARVPGSPQRSFARETVQRGRTGWSGVRAHRGSGGDGAAVGGSLRAGSGRGSGRMGWSRGHGPGPKLPWPKGQARDSCDSRVIRWGGPSSVSRKVWDGLSPRPWGGAECQVHPLRRPGRPSPC